MGKNKKKKNYQRVLNNKKNFNNNKINSNKNQPKKILDGVDLANFNQEPKELDKKIDKEETILKNNNDVMDNLHAFHVDKVNENENTQEEVDFNEKKEPIVKFNLNENIQSFVSILFTIIIFIALILLIYVLYDNYLKKDKEDVCDINEVCQDYIKKDYNIKEDDVANYIKTIRGIIYNLDEFNIEELENDDYLNLATYFIWNLDSDYLICDQMVDSNCLTTKKEIEKVELNKYFKEYLNINNPKISFASEFLSDDKIRLYELDSKVILTFSEFEYQTLKHDIVDIRIDEDKISVIFALSKKIENSTLYTYVGYKNLELKYLDKRFIIESIKTSLNNN